MKVIFFGTPDYVVPIVDKLNKFHEVIAVVTQPPQPVGREKKIKYSPIDAWAHKKKVPVHFDYADLPDADIGVLASYGELIPKEVINKFPYGILVIHPSLLPHFRWSSPVPATIITGTNPTGSTIIKMNEAWDAGPIVTQFKEDVHPDDTFESLRNRLFDKSADVLIEILPIYQQSKINLKPQDDTKTSFARQVKKADAFIKPEYIHKALRGEVFDEDWEIKFIRGFSTKPTAQVIERVIRAFDPWPIAWTLVGDKRLKILKAHLENGKLAIDTVQLEGKNPVSYKQFANAYPQYKF